MTTILHEVRAFPPDYEYRYGTLDSLSEYDAERLAPTGITEAWYWYAYGEYEGSGQLIGRNAEGKWTTESLGHCSCYGPTEEWSALTWHDSLDALEAYLLDDARKQVSHLIEAIREGH